MYLPGVLPALKAEPLLYFCDESHIRTSDWMGVGGLAVAPSRAAMIAADLVEINLACRLSANTEIKFSKCRERRQNAHVAYLDYLFDAVEKGHVHFHVRLSPFKRYDHSASGQRKETDTISKAFYQLLLHRPGRYYGDKRRLLIRPDQGDCTAYLPSMRMGLNTDICRIFEYDAAPVGDIIARDSKVERLLQLLDVGLGALTAARNGNHENGTLQAHKAALVGRALERAGIKDIGKSHPIEDRSFNVWNVIPKWEKGAIPTG